jgi:hypothetical protein
VKTLSWKSLLMYAIGVGLLGWVLSANWSPKVQPDGTSTPGLSELLQKPVNPTPLIFAAMIAAFSLLLTFYRWYLLVRAQNLPFTFQNALRLGLVGFFFNSFLPGSIGGDAVKAYGIAKEQSRRTVAVATVLIDRGIGLWGLVWLVAIAGGILWVLQDPILLSNPGLFWIVKLSWIVTASSVSVWVLLGFLPERRAARFAQRLKWFPRVGNSLAEFWGAVWMYRKQSKAVAVALGLALVGHVGFVMSFHFATRIFESSTGGSELASVHEHLVLVPVGMVVQALFPAPGGVGGGEAAFGWLYTLVGKPFVSGVLGCLTQRILTWGLAMIGFLLYIRMNATAKTRQPELSQTTTSTQTNTPLVSLVAGTPAD